MRLRGPEHLLRHHARIASVTLTSPLARQLKRYSTSSKAKDVAIIGGGITGLSAAYFLTQELPNTKITIYEAAPRVGGWLASKHVEVADGRILFEQGPRTLRNSQNGRITAQLIADLGLVDDVIYTSKDSAAARNRYVYYPDHLVKLPAPTPGDMYQTIWDIGTAVLREPVFKGLAWGLMTEGFREARPTGLQDESVGHFFSRRLGTVHPVNNLLSAALHGIHGGDVWKLSVRSLVPQFWRYEAENTSVAQGILDSLNKPTMPLRDVEMVNTMVEKSIDPEFMHKIQRCATYTFRGGIQQLITGLEAALRENENVTFMSGTKVTKISKVTAAEQQSSASTSDGIQVEYEDSGSIELAEDKPSPTEPTVSNHDYAISTLFAKRLSEIAPLPSLASTHAVTVMVVNVYFQNPKLLPVNGFGYLIPQSAPLAQNPERALGVIFDSDAVHGQDTADGTKITVMLGGHWWDGWDEYPDEQQGTEMARTILARHLGIVDEPGAVHVSLQKECIPQHNVGHIDKLSRAHDALLREFRGRLRVAGNSYEGVGMHDCVRSAWEVVKGLKANVEGSMGHWGDKTGLEHYSGPQKYAVVQPRSVPIKE